MIKTKNSRLFSSDFIYVLILLLAPFCVMAIKGGIPEYYNNDDFYINQLVSGVYTGTPEAHLIHIGYLTGLFLSTLYRLFSQVPWYGIYIVGCGLGTIILVFFSFIKYAEKVWQKLLLCVTCLFLICGFLLQHILQFQYTTVTAMVCGGAIVLFYKVGEKGSIREYLRCQIPSFILFCMAFELRNKACIMLLPILGFLGIVRFLQNKKMFRQLVSYAGVLLCLMAVLFVVEKAAYSKEEWKDFKRYNTTRENVVDYQGYPDYEKNREIYEEFGITRASYDAIVENYMMLLDKNIDADFMEKMADISPEYETSLSQMIREFFVMHTNAQYDWPMNRMVFLMYGMVILMAIMTKKFKALADVGALVLGRMVIWAYLLYIGRPISRVTQGVYIVEMFVLGAVFCYNRLWQHKENQKKLLLGIFIAAEITGTILVSYRWGDATLSDVIKINENTEKDFQEYEEIREYLSKQPDNLYLLDVWSFAICYGNALRETPKWSANCVMLGGWCSNGPWTEKVGENYGISDFESAAIEQDNIYFVVSNDGDFPYEYLENYYEEKYPGSELEVEETLRTSAGNEFFILRCVQ